MSLFRPEVLCMAIEADRAVIVKVADGRRPRVLADDIVSLPAALDADSQLPGFDVLTERLSTPEFRCHRMRIVFKDTLVRFFIVDRPHGLRSRGVSERP